MPQQVDRRFFETIMASKKLSLRGLATKMDCTHSQLSLTFSGQRRMQLDEAAKLAEILGVPLHRIAEAAGVASGRANGKRVDVIGAMRGDGTVELHPGNVVERTTAPEGLPDNIIAVQAHTSESQSAWMDGFVFFCVRTDEVEPDAVGRFCLCKVESGPVVLATVRRGYRENSYNLTGPYAKESERLEWASPILMTRM